jgi:hypothetical protein
MADGVNQEEYRRALAADAAANAARLRELGSELDEDRLRRRPAEGGWSVGEVYEHLCVSDDSYLVRMRSILARPDTPRAPLGAVEWRPSLAGGMLANGLRGERKLPSPRAYKPGPTPRPNVVAEYLKRQTELARMLDDAARLEWRRIRLGSPVLGLIRMNLGDCFTILVVHAARHIRQIERVKAGL